MRWWRVSRQARPLNQFDGSLPPRNEDQKLPCRQDAENGITSVRRAGAGIIRFEGEYSAEKLFELGAQRVVNCLYDLLVRDQFK